MTQIRKGRRLDRYEKDHWFHSTRDLNEPVEAVLMMPRGTWEDIQFMSASTRIPIASIMTLMVANLTKDASWLKDGETTFLDAFEFGELLPAFDDKERWRYFLTPVGERVANATKHLAWTNRAIDALFELGDDAMGYLKQASFRSVGDVISSTRRQVMRRLGWRSAIVMDQLDRALARRGVTYSGPALTERNWPLFTYVNKGCGNRGIEEVLSSMPATVTTLKKCGVETVYDLIDLTEPELRRMPGIGPKTAEKVISAIDEALKWYESRATSQGLTMEDAREEVLLRREFEEWDL